MKLGIIGKPQSGKTTLFNAASEHQEAVGDFSQAIHRAVIKVPDHRLGQLADIVSPKKITQAEIEFLDAPGFSGKGKQSSGIEISSDLRLMDAFVLVVDTYSSESSPVRDIQSIIDEMILVDQAMVESNLDKRERKIKVTGDKSELGHLELLRRCLTFLESEKPLIEMDFSPEESKEIRGYQFVSQKPLLIVLNISEDNILTANEIPDDCKPFESPGKRELAVVCGKVEMELVALEAADRMEFMTDLGIKVPAVEQVIRKSYSLLGLISFLTAGEPEVRAWTINRGTSAQKAAGVIHSDIERGFIRAEVVAFDDYIELRTPAAMKAAGKARLEGKEYVIKDGDVILFRFNV